MAGKILIGALVCGAVILAYSLARSATMADVYMECLKQEKAGEEACCGVEGGTE